MKSAGLEKKDVMLALRTLMLIFEGEVAWPATCEFWDQSTPMGKATLRVRQQGYEIARLLWPTSLLGAIPTFDVVMESLPNPVEKGVKECVRQSKLPNSAVSKQLATLGSMSMRPNLIWTLVHYVTFNLPDVMSPAQVEAARFLATWLAENFWCDDCRSFFQVGVIQEYLGLPPQTNDGLQHARWWWMAHNMASEHVATSRGGHPWVFQLGEDGYAQYQNPYYMAWEDAVEMWRVGGM
jgi:hypothetical protein